MAEKQSAPIDYRDLLRRYMEHVGDCEGTTFVWQLNHAPGSDIRFTEAEETELQRIELEILGSDEPKRQALT